MARCALTEIEFCAWVAQAVPGDRLEHHRGFSVLDIFPMVHEGRMSKDEGWEAICGHNAVMLCPARPLDWLQRESDRL